MNDVLERKKNIFEHIFYEIEMYFFSHECCIVYSKAMAAANNEEVRAELQKMYNMAWDAHMLHLRNLFEFFNDASNTIGFHTVLIIPNDLIIEDSETKYKQVINKSVDHLTIERVNWDNLTYRALDTINEMWEVLPYRIQKFLNYLCHEEMLQEKYRADLRADFVVKKRDALINLISSMHV